MKKSSISVSIILVSKNSYPDIEKTINSVIKQDYPNKELIVIDGGSTDGTGVVIKKYQKSIAYWVSEKDKGISDAFNKGVKQAKGDYLYFLGAGDCFWKDNVLKKMMKNVDTGKTDLVCGRINRISGFSGKILYTTSTNFKKWHLLYKMGLPHQALFTSKHFFNKYGLFDTRLKYAMDYDLLLRAYKSFPGVVFKDMVVAGWQDGGIGTNQTMKVLDEYRKIRIKNKIAPVWLIHLIYFVSKIKYQYFSKAN